MLFLLSGSIPVVTDLGIAKALHAARMGPATGTLTGTSMSLGTPAYIAAEPTTTWLSTRMETFLSRYSDGGSVSNCRVDIISSVGALINQISNSGHCADGATYGQGAVFANNTGGTITRYDFAEPGYTGPFTTSIIASGKSTYGDFAGAGADGAFYVIRANQR